MRLTMKQARVGAGLSQKEMATMLGVTEQTYLGWEKEPTKMKLGYLIKFSRITRVRIENLEFGATQI